MATYAELVQQIADLEKQAAEQLRAEKAGNIQKVKQFMQQMNVTLEDLGGVTAKRRSGAKGVIRYRDPASGKGWSGRGRKPAWVVDALAAGRGLEDFAV